MILAFCVAAREFASMGRRLFSRRLGDIGTRSRLQTLDGRPTSSASASSWMGATATAWPAGPYPLQADSSPWRTHALSAHVHLPKPLLVWDVRRMTDGAIVNVVATISMQAAVVACGRQGSTRFSANYIHKRWLAPGVTTVPYVAEHRLTTALPMPRTGSSSSQFGTECLRRLQAG